MFNCIKKFMVIRLVYNLKHTKGTSWGTTIHSNIPHLKNWKRWDDCQTEIRSRSDHLCVRMSIVSYRIAKGRRGPIDGSIEKFYILFRNDKWEIFFSLDWSRSCKYCTNQSIILSKYRFEFMLRLVCNKIWMEYKESQQTVYY